MFSESRPPPPAPEAWVSAVLPVIAGGVSFFSGKFSSGLAVCCAEPESNLMNKTRVKGGLPTTGASPKGHSNSSKWAATDNPAAASCGYLLVGKTVDALNR